MVAYSKKYMYKKSSKEMLITIFVLSVLSISLLIFGKSTQKSRDSVTVPKFPINTVTAQPENDSTLTVDESTVAPANEGQDEPETVVVKRVIDGDTIELASGEKVRYIGIDTPELQAKNGGGVQCYAGEAAARNVQLVFQKKVRLVADKDDRDTYGRLLRYVYIGDTFVNRTLVEEGYAYAKQYRPNTAKQRELVAAMQSAQQNNRGLWDACK